MGGQGLDRRVEAVHRAGLERGAPAAVCQPARLFRARTQAGRAAHRPPAGGAGQPQRGPGRRLRQGARRAAVPGQGLSVPHRRPLGQRRSGHALQRRAVRDAAPDFGHVPPLPCARRRHGAARHLPQRGHLERQPDRAQARGAAVLPQRARRAADDAGRWHAAGAGARGGDPGRQHTAALPGRAAAPEVPGGHAPVQRGQELGWFEHGSTIIVFAPPGFTLAEGVAEGARVRMGQALLQRPGSAA